jgi:hypothetical protein
MAKLFSYAFLLYILAFPAQAADTVTVDPVSIAFDGFESRNLSGGSSAQAGGSAGVVSSLPMAVAQDGGFMSTPVRPGNERNPEQLLQAHADLMFQPTTVNPIRR